MNSSTTLMNDGM